MADTPPQTTNLHMFPLNAVILPLFALTAILLSLPPLVWHAKNLNIAAFALTLWLILLNSNNFINPLIWPTDDWTHAWMGRGYCDIQIRVVIGAINGGIPACVLAISRALAKALDTKKQVIHHDRRDMIRNYVFEAVLGLGVPIFFMVAYYLVQDVRYYIVPVYGCEGGFDASWVSIVLFFVPPVIMCLVSTYYSVLVIYRIYTHRRQITSILTANKTTRSRFLRLFVLSLLILVPALPGSLYSLIAFCLPNPTTGLTLHPYNYTAVHNNWNNAVLVPSHYGQLEWDRWVWVAYGFFIFCCFGIGEDARKEYRAWAAAVGLGRCFPSLHRDQQAPSEFPSSTSSRGSLSAIIAKKWKAKREERKASWSSEFTMAYELPTVEPTYQPKKASTWFAFVNMPGSFAQAVAGVQNLPRRPAPAANFLESTSSAGTLTDSNFDGETLIGSMKSGHGDYV